MNRDDTIELWLQGEDAWNAWAKEMLAEREALEAAGRWSAKEIGPWLEGLNNVTIKWVKEAYADFSGIQFSTKNQPGIGEDIASSSDHSVQTINVESDELDFNELIFPANANFHSARFAGDAEFDTAEFAGLADFSFARFSGEADFHSARFSGVAYFHSAEFSSDATFGSARFRGAASFDSAEFSGEAYFGSAKFFGPTNFRLAEFKNLVFWNRARFRKSADFHSIRSQRAFSLTEVHFAQPPDFIEADFHTPPVLDDMTVKNPLEERQWKWCENVYSEKKDPRSSWFKNCPVANAAGDYRKFRALRKLATDSGDHQQEMEFFAQETRCRRFWHDKPQGSGMGRFWFGLAYQFFSDFGRSFWRPIIGWLSTVVVFTLVYSHAAKSLKFCESFLDSLYLSARQGLVFSGFTRTGKLAQVIKDLYGDSISHWVGFAMLGQTVISAVFLFLFFLALRNHFRIK